MKKLVSLLLAATLAVGCLVGCGGGQQQGGQAAGYEIALVTDKGDIETHQFVEGKTQAQVTHKYTFECNETQEKLNIPGFELLDGILIEKNPYFDTGLVFSDVNKSIYTDGDDDEPALQLASLNL